MQLLGSPCIVLYAAPSSNEFRSLNISTLEISLFSCTEELKESQKVVQSFTSLLNLGNTNLGNRSFGAVVGEAVDEAVDIVGGSTRDAASLTREVVTSFIRCLQLIILQLPPQTPQFRYQ